MVQGTRLSCKEYKLPLPAKNVGKGFQTMEITIVGTGCAKCNKLEEITREAVRELNIDAQVNKMTDINEIAKTGILMTPGLIIDGKVKLSGKLPSKNDVIKLIKASI
jgi:small redox-active disulfide protein 2